VSILEAVAGKPGSKTSEFKAMGAVVLTIFLTLISEVLGLGLLAEGTALYTIATLAISAATALGYGGLRTVRKNFKTRAMVEAARGADTAPDPT